MSSRVSLLHAGISSRCRQFLVPLRAGFCDVAHAAESFADRKTRTLGKSDKSGKGSVDPPVAAILDLINAHDRLFTTSSCSGRCYLRSGFGIPSKRDGQERHRETHEVPCAGYLDLSEDRFVVGWWWLRFEPFILHVRCHDLEAAGQLLCIARGSGIKDVSVQSLGLHPTLSMSGEDILEMPIVMDGVKVIDLEQRPALQLVLEEKFRKNLQRIARLETALRELPDETIEALRFGAVAAQQAGPWNGAYEVVGDIVILKRRFKPEDIAGVADNVLQILPSVRTVAVPDGGTSETSRAASLKVIRGGPDLRTKHIENGISLEVDLATCFFTPAMAPERKRIALLVKPGEVVLELFSGVGAQAALLALQTSEKSARPTLVDCVESSADAAKLCVLNVQQNGVADRVRVFQEDAKHFSPPADRCGGYDVVLCPRPELSDLFLVEAVRCARPGGRIHWYFCGSSAELDIALQEGRVEVQAAYDQRRSLVELARRKAPRRSIGRKGRYRWCVDLEVLG